MIVTPQYPTRLTAVAVLLAMLISLFGRPTPVLAQDDRILDSSVYLLNSGLIPDRRGQFSTMLRSLRQLQDPDLAPMFRDLTLSEHRIMRIHGILGLAEIATPKQVDLKLLADVKDPAMQSELIGAALDSELLSKENAKLIIAWPGMELDAKVVIATHLLEDKLFNDVALLKKAAETENLARKGIVALLLTQLGDPAGPTMLADITKMTDKARDPVRNLILQTAYRFKFESIAPWAVAVCSEPGVDEQLGLLAMRTAMRFGHKGAMNLWTQRWNAATEMADQMRLGLSLLNLSQYLEPASFDRLIAHPDPLLKQMGVAGKAVALKQGVSEQVTKLIKMDYSVANAWAVGYATNHATKEDARAIFTQIIRNYELADDRNKTQRLDEAMIAAQFLAERDADGAMQVIRPLLNQTAGNKQFVQGMIVALIRAMKGEPHKIALEMSQNLEDLNTNALRSLLLGKHDVKLTAAQLKDLGLLVRGGGSLPDALRLQAAWVYLKQTGQTKVAVERALKR